MRRLLLWCALSLAVALSQGVERGEAQPGDDAEAPIVHASRACPAVLRESLPTEPLPGAVPSRLPGRPCLVLGLVDDDAAARELGEALGLLETEEDLRGGYVVATWRDAGHPRAVLLAADAAGLRRAWDRHGPAARLLSGPAGVHRAQPAFAARWVVADPLRDATEAWRLACDGYATGWDPGSTEAAADLRVRATRTGVETGPPPRHGSWRRETAPGRRARPGAPPLLPTLPPDWRVRPVPHGDVLLVEAGPGAREILDAAWSGPPATPLWEGELLPHLPRGDDSPQTLLLEAAEGLRRASHPGGAGPVWAVPLAAHLERMAGRVPDTAIVVPRVPAGVEADGRLDEAPWAHARSLGASADGDQVLAVADGYRLALGVRLARAGGARIVVEDEGSRALEVDLGPGARQPPGVQVGASSPTRLEIALDGDALDADAYPTRVLALRLLRDGRAVLARTLVLGR